MDREEKIEIARIILNVIALAGFLSVFALAPNALQVIGQFKRFKNDLKQLKRRGFTFRINRAVKRLENRGLIEIVNNRVRLTPAGQKELSLYETNKKVIERPKRWDGKWRIVMFDIWEKRRVVRDAVRRRLDHLGFVRLQHSVWAFPYECREVVNLLKTYYKVRPAVLYMVVESLENDGFLRQKFNLKITK